jgi:hypothetical protein
MYSCKLSPDDWTSVEPITRPTSLTSEQDVCMHHTDYLGTL